LPEQAAGALRTAAEANVSAVSPWEVAIKAASGKLQLREPPAQWFLGLAERYRLRELPLDARLACAAAALPLIHRDPFDRVLVALAQAHSLPILTSDQNIPKYPGVKTLW
jgi:PIN domain nuclease of toxin-antitoxin system